MEKVLTKAFTDTEIIEKVRNLPDKDLVRLYLDFLPREVRSESIGSVTLVIQGLERKVLGAEQIVEALPEPGNDE
jgi:hypothetical protein